MFSKKSTSINESFDSLVASNASFEGVIHSSGVVRVDGKFIGDINVEGDLIVGETGNISGNINAVNVTLGGYMEGKIHARGVLRLMTTAKLNGDIEVLSLITEEGAIFKGSCSMLEDTVNSSKLPDITEKSTKKSITSKEYKKSSVLSPLYEDSSEKAN